ncbi:acyl-CoA dehydrogenase [Noviherbaspirillum pedocola]|uniref:3-methylmercaptopropionyl-CoA dehydrogenase n=1 Tax=Noviherbaspirillum pedocola TaxID=2801341 RepID=A0A934SPN2_9BURK|nr:acyl-CoA dehydrogenase [Noviherbaspirillum pedocola]MBK4734416.1 acyl-CoA dehydrogenase [Noviherbaspirillum pedocola]
MSQYRPPLSDIRFLLQHVFDIDAHSRATGASLDLDTALAIAEEAGRLASDRIDPINRAGDVHGARWKDGEVSTAPGFADAWRAFREGGWSALRFPEEYGGQGLPMAISAVVDEMWHAASISFALCPMLTNGAAEALLTAASDTLKATYLEKLVSGAWTGTMNLTEPQAGSDLAAVKTRALAQADGSYRIHGQKIFITYGEHDMAENIIHLVLARTPDAPAGVKGISLFVVPKFLVGTDGRLGARNDVRCASIEHKLGIHGSPTAVMLFGEHEGAIGYLVGEENRGLETMFIMMNEARFAVGLQGLAISERAYQHALAYARERVQGKALGEDGSQGTSILRHPDVRRMLLGMRSHIDAMRALAVYVAMQKDIAHAPDNDAGERDAAQRRMEFLVPIVKGWFTENAQHITSDALQVFGGMGFIEETGAAQYLRDARILTIYEGTTAIQANDLVGRKTLRDDGATAAALLDAIETDARRLEAVDGRAAASLRAALAQSCAALRAALLWMRETQATDARAVYAGAVPYLECWGLLCGGWMHARRLLAATTLADAGTLPDASAMSAGYFAEHALSRIPGLAASIMSGASFALHFPDSAW